jgi:outer membrane receptor protein involved in Fe transport
VPEAEVASGAVFGFEQLRLGIIDLLGGARVDVRHLEPKATPVLNVAGEGHDYVAASGNFGVVLHVLSELGVSANIGRAWRAPNFFELFANGPRIGEARYEIGRADLDAETSLNVDVGIHWQRDILRVELDGYRNQVSDYIFLMPTDSMRDGLRIFEHTQTDAVLLGAEALAEVDPFEYLTLRGRYDYVHGDNDTDDEPLPLMPPARAAVDAELHFSHVGWADRLYFDAEVESVAKQTRLSRFDTPTDGYALVNVGAGVEGELGGVRLRVDARVTNVADTRYRDFLSRYKDFADDPGRNIALHVGVDF